MGNKAMRIGHSSIGNNRKPNSSNLLIHASHIIALA